MLYTLTQPLCRRLLNQNAVGGVLQGFTHVGDRVPCAVGQGAYGGQSPLCRRPGGAHGGLPPVQKIEMKKNH